MEWNVIFDLIDPALMVVVAACWVIGVIFKQIPGMPNWPIPFVVLIVSVLLSIGLLGASVETVIQGILAGAFAVYGHQLIKQGVQGAKNDD